jgi:hypothetical protein
MFPDTCWYGYFFLFWYLELVPKICLHFSVTFSVRGSTVIVASDVVKHIVTHMPITRQWLGKYTPELTLSIIEGYPLLGNGPTNRHS